MTTKNGLSLKQKYTAAGYRSSFQKKNSPIDEARFKIDNNKSYFEIVFEDSTKYHHRRHVLRYKKYLP
ncbi:hypothetical protein NLU14_21005 [Marinobacter sp. 71-i]|uniref:Uncharacterized protein n=1 Tax=Marinobacter iranensis TaxID=2962607 RepID=A0ABT5YGK8_9GAMM|nr:hypothetical protein [Marinobacter iranensis]MDF0752712.1 hypothetical protein [Marinobacter iranensis]